MRLGPPPGEDAALWVLWGLGLVAVALGAVVGVWGVLAVDTERTAVALATLTVGVGVLLGASGVSLPHRPSQPPPPSVSGADDPKDEDF